ncbi:hypothetical protein M9H77_22192 [Catharanthus roseus]|uniref:Uncharacterized protein n=1 Tax=Catharanthus roseus TaxID=4058 RepID=A0ACC0AQP1_CATRO|nr:hypothetical protein M9H77_22192 [Catharanthus roseus]
MKKLKASNRNEDNGMVAYMEEALKNKFEEFGGQGKASKLFAIPTLPSPVGFCRVKLGIFRTYHRREVPPIVDVSNQGFNGYFKPLSYRLARRFFKEGGEPQKRVESKVTSNWIFINNV